MITNITFLAIALYALYIGADWLVKGSSSIALKMKISPLVIGLTVVAFGTSTPELVVSLQAAFQGGGDIAIGNLAGSNIFNTCMILGIAALISPLQAKRQLTRWDIPIMLLASGLFVYFLQDGLLSRAEGLLFVTGVVAYTLFSFVYSRKGETQEKDLQDKSSRWYMDVFYMLVGIGILIVGSRLLVENATLIAQALGVSEAVIALTIVAAGTSMPELATSVVAAMKKDTEIAVGNAVGSNLFNILAISGITSTIHPIAIQHINNVDLLVMLGTSVMLLPLAWTGNRISRGEGLLLVVIYVVYTLWLLGVIPV
ncbi:MAG: calcium/sodium antiporter [Parabacteroides sp.]